MTEDPSPARRRRRRRATAAQGAPAAREAPVPGPEAAPGAVPAPDEPAAVADPPQVQHKRPRQARDSPERGLRDLVGAGKSQLGVDGALRGRDVNRPTDDDLAEAEQSLVIVRRHWQPPPDRTEPGNARK